MNSFLSSVLFISVIGYTLAGEWSVQSNHVCFGAKKNTFGVIEAQNSGKITEIKFEYRSGFVSCNKEVDTCRSRWGCDCFSHDYLSVFVTDAKSKILFPTSVSDAAVWYTLPGYQSTSDIVVFKSEGVQVKAGDVLKVWYGEDLKDSTADNNEGTVCARVSAKFE